MPLPEDALVLLPVRDLVLFPGMIVPIAVGRPASVAAVQQAVREERPVGVILQRDPAADDPGPDGLHRIGTVANILRYMTAPDGTPSHRLPGRAALPHPRPARGDAVPGRPGLPHPGGGEPAPRDRGPLPQPRRRWRVEAIGLLAAGAAGPARVGAGDHLARARSPTSSAAYLDIKPEEKQEILETVDLSARMDRVSRLLAQRIEVLRISARDRPADQGRLRRAPARGGAARADGGDPAPARRGRRQGRGGGRALRGDRQGRHARGGRGAGAQGAAPLRAHARGGRRGAAWSAPISTG